MGNMVSGKPRRVKEVRFPIVFTVVKVELDGYIYGDSGRKIENIHALSEPANVVASGYVRFKARVEPSGIADNLYYKWTTTAGTLVAPTEGAGSNFLAVKWDAPDGHEQDIELSLEIKESTSGPTICAKTADLKTIRPYIIRVKFVDDFWDEEQHLLENGSESDPEFDATTGTKGPVCYVRDRGMQVELDLAGDENNDSDNDLTERTEIKVTAKAVYDGGTENEFNEDFIDDDTEDWSTEDYSTVDIESDDNVPNEVAEYEDFEMRWAFKVKDSSGNWIVAYEDTAGCGYSQKTEHKETSGGKTYGLYLTYDGHKFDDDADFKKLILDYACNWSDGQNNKEPIITDLLNNGFNAHYTWVGDCFKLASDFVRLCRTLGINAGTRFWGASNYTTATWNEPPYNTTWAVDDMLAMRTIHITPVGSTGSARHEWGFHQWAEANSKTRDPSAASTFDGGWGAYEDYLFETADPPGGYWRVTSVDATGNPTAAQWEANHPGRTYGCEPNGVYGSGKFWSWRGPDR